MSFPWVKLVSNFGPNSFRKRKKYSILKIGIYRQFLTLNDRISKFVIGWFNTGSKLVCFLGSKDRKAQFIKTEISFTRIFSTQKFCFNNYQNFYFKIKIIVKIMEQGKVWLYKKKQSIFNWVLRLNFWQFLHYPQKQIALINFTFAHQNIYF